MKLHFVGIKGVGMTPLSIIAKEAGFDVTGCDLDKPFITDEALRKAGIIPLIGFDESHLTGIDMVITTGAHGGVSNPEVVSAKEMGIEVVPQGKAVGIFMEGAFLGKTYTGISVSGCHGKTTTSAMIATILMYAGKDPSFTIGTSDLYPIGLPGHFGHGDYFIAEADEYMTMPGSDKTAKFLHLNPKISVITNIEYDHPDVYDNIEQVRSAYLSFVKKIPDDGTVIVNGDDENIRIVVSLLNKHIVSFGYNGENDYRIIEVIQNHEHTLVTLRTPQGEQKLSLLVSGTHNVLNAVAAYIVAIHVGIENEVITEALQSFTGTKRRMEYKGTLSSGALLYDDYAHHPTEIKTSLLGVKQKYSDKNIVCIFQPHTYSRTKLLFEDFSTSFDSADTIIITDIFTSAREERDDSVSSEHLVKAIQKQGKEAIYLSTLDDVIQYLGKKDYSSNTIILTMGAGDIYTIAKELTT